MKVSAVLFLIVILTISGCKKGRADIILKGTVTDSTFNTVLSGATIRIYELEAGGGDLNLLGTATIGSNGSYSFSFPRNPVESYLIEIRKSNYFDADVTIPLSDLTIEEDNIRNFSTTAKAWAGLRFVSSGSGTVTYTRQQGKIGCSECCPATQQTLNAPIDTLIYCPNDGNTMYSYSYNANGSLGVKEVTTTPFDTSIVTLSF
jgi:hypothetical protein